MRVTIRSWAAPERDPEPLPTHRRNPRKDVTMKRYETPALTAAGSFRKRTGLLQFRGNDRLILSKN
ncbi:hypothetical protein GCM10009678_22500 [Actinomadura kijaniata]